MITSCRISCLEGHTNRPQTTLYSSLSPSLPLPLSNLSVLTLPAPQSLLRACSSLLASLTIWELMVSYLHVLSSFSLTLSWRGLPFFFHSILPFFAWPAPLLGNMSPAFCRFAFCHGAQEPSQGKSQKQVSREDVHPWAGRCQ